MSQTESETVQDLREGLRILTERPRTCPTASTASNIGCASVVRVRRQRMAAAGASVAVVILAVPSTHWMPSRAHEFGDPAPAVTAPVGPSAVEIAAPALVGIGAPGAGGRPAGIAVGAALARDRGGHLRADPCRRPRGSCASMARSDLPLGSVLSPILPECSASASDTPSTCASLSVNASPGSCVVLTAALVIGK